MQMTLEARKQIISRLLTQQPGGEVNSVALAEQVLWLWEQITFHLTPLIGVSGFQTLYAHSLYLASSQCPGLTITKGQHTDANFQSLKKDLIAMECDMAHQCGNALLNTFTELVESMIGEMLMTQILRSAWVGQSPNGDIAELSRL